MFAVTVVVQLAAVSVAVTVVSRDGGVETGTSLQVDVDVADLYMVKQPAPQCLPSERQGKSTVTVGTVRAQSQGFEMVDHARHFGTAQVEQTVPVLVTVGQCVSFAGGGVGIIATAGSGTAAARDPVNLSSENHSVSKCMVC